VIEWRPVVGNARAIVSACGKYSVARVTVDGVDRFEAWKVIDPGHHGAQLLGSSLHASEAKAIAERETGEPSAQVPLL
jgi:hypothetical protein